MKIEIENLKAQMRGRELTLYQKGDALCEFNRLLEYVEKLEAESKSATNAGYASPASQGIQNGGLLPCPFCGGEAEIVRVGGEYYPMCKGKKRSMCYANRTPVKGFDGFRFEQDAIAYWNKRG